MDAIPNNLPLQLSSFIGREREIAEVTRLLTTSRLVTLTGAGGSGKTRLALEIAFALCRDAAPEPRYPDGVWFVDLAPLSDSSLVADRIAAILKVIEQPNQSLLSTLSIALQSKAVLLILDNCEHLIDTCAQVAETLLQGCAGLFILATSREPLNIAGETTLIVPSLSVPASATKVSPDALTSYEATHLFVERAKAARPAFALTPMNTTAVVEICRQLDGMPLAIELAAARVSASSVEQIALRLTDRFQLLAGGRRTALPRHQTLRAAIDWSYDLLSESEQQLLLRLSVFSGSWTLEAAEEVAGIPPLASADVLDLMTSLVNKSLIHVEAEADELRYGCSATVREHAYEKLRQSVEFILLQDQHLAWCLRLMEQAAPQLRCAAQAVWLKCLAREQDNLATALSWSLGDGRGLQGLPDRIRKGVHLAELLGYHWNIRGDYAYGRVWLGRAIALDTSVGDPRGNARLLVGIGILAVLQGDFAFAVATLEHCIALCAEQANPEVQGYATSWLAQVRIEQGSFAAAMQLAEAGVALRRAANYRWGIGQGLFVLGRAHLVLDELARARACYEESITIFRECGDRFYLAFLLGHLGSIASRQGEFESARALFMERLAIGQELGSGLLTVSARVHLSNTALKQGSFQEAALLAGETLAELRQMGAKREIIYRLEAIARLAAIAQKPLEAARLLGAVEILHAQTGSRAADRGERDDVEAAISEIRKQAAEDAIQRAWSQGRTLTLEQIMDEAQRILSSIRLQPNVLAPPPGLPAGLTPREVEVLRFVAHGLTNAEIAETLYVSPRTVGAHLRSIFGKLDVTTRTAAARVALENKLI